MAIRPQFVRGDSFSGFDKEARPRWLMIRRRFSQQIFLVNGAGWVVQSQNTNIATIREDSIGIPNLFNGREFWITGESPGVTFIEAYLYHSGKIPVARLLEVNVKDERSFNIAFQFVTDNIIEKTTRPTSIADELVSILNDIYGSQANITFTKTREVFVDVKTSLLLIVDLDKPNDDGSLRHYHREWDKLVPAGDPGANINVFFMPWDGPDDKRPSQMLGSSVDFVCPDGMLDDEVKIALPHMIGHFFLGCPVTFDSKKSHHLMFWRRAEGFNPHPTDVFSSFIPKECANAMN
jgi:hypothetical protein